MTFIKVEGGQLIIPASCYFAPELTTPQRIVTVGDFYIMDFVVEQADWIKTMGENPSFFKGDGLPVECITWYDAIRFCNQRSIVDGLRPCYSIDGEAVECDFGASGYRLPTEAEWEYAARGGKYSQHFLYAGSDNLDEVAWYAKNSRRTTHPKGGKKPNELGLYDMCGNVFEWCWDFYGKYDKPYEENPRGPQKGKDRIVRGNCWVNGASVSNLERRVARGPYTCNHHLGVRLVRSV